MNISSKLINLTEQVSKNNTNSNHHLSRSSTKIDEQLGSKVLAEDVYHKGEHIPQNATTYTRPLEMTTVHFDPDSIVKAEQTIYSGELPDQLSFIRPQFNKIVEKIESEEPALRNKNWGYSVDAKGTLIALGDISEDERTLIEEKLNEDDRFVRLNQAVPEILTRGLEYDRAYSGRSKYWGKYDVTTENFKDIVDLKSLLKSTEGPHADKFHNNVDGFAYLDNLGSQLAKAEIKYGY